MTTLFVHDHIFIERDNQYYSEGKLTYKTWMRFLEHDDKLIVVGRCEGGIDIDVSNLNLSSGDNVSFHCLPKVSVVDRIFTRKVDEHIVKSLSLCDNVICRVPSFLGFRAYILAKKLSKNIALEVVGCPFDAMMNHGSIAGKLLAWFERAKLKKIVSRSDVTFYVTSSFLQQRYPSPGRSYSISNVELVDSCSVVSIEEEAFKLSFIGSLSANYKGLDDLIKALAVLKSENSRAELHILGGGDRTKYSLLAKGLGLQKSVFFYSPVKGGKEVLEWLKQSHLYVQPSHTEGLPRALIEAMSIGLPCIATDVGGVPELLSQQYLVSPKSPEALAKVIGSCLASYDLRKEQSLRNYQTAEAYRYDNLRKKRYNALKDFYGR
ncbi:hypothetical protein A3732_08330 [Oleiphilus sp. HI0050]|nr:hypothetical protein A3732_08330 [Oleiphilus sp. HI0050]